MRIERKIGELKRWIFNEGDLPVQFRVMRTDEIKPVEHLHRTMYECFYILQGKIKIMVEDQEHQLATNDLLYVAPGERHKVLEMSEDLELLLVMPPPEENDKVVF